MQVFWWCSRFASCHQLGSRPQMMLGRAVFPVLHPKGLNHGGHFKGRWCSFLLCPAGDSEMVMGTCQSLPRELCDERPEAPCLEAVWLRAAEPHREHGPAGLSMTPCAWTLQHPLLYSWTDAVGLLTGHTAVTTQPCHCSSRGGG